MDNAFEKTAVLPKCDKGSAYSTQINLRLYDNILVDNLRLLIM